MRRDEIIDVIGKKIRLVLISGQHYTGVIFEISESNSDDICLVQLKDKFNNYLRFHSDKIEVIEVLNENEEAKNV